MELQSTFILTLISLAVFTSLTSRNAERSKLEANTRFADIQFKNLRVESLGFAEIAPWIAGAALATGLWVQLGTLTTPQICTFVILVASYGLYNHAVKWPLRLGSGFFSVATASILHSFSLTIWGAVLISLAVALITLLASQQKRFIYRENIKEDALLLILIFAILISVIPPIEQGWYSAQAINIGVTAGLSEHANIDKPAWFYALLALSISLGALVSLVKRHSISNKV